MKWIVSVKVILCLLSVLLTQALFAAEYRNGQLYLEILLNSGSQLTFKSQGTAKPIISITEAASPISRVLQDNLSITLIDADRNMLWGFLNRTEPWQDQEEGVLREYFAWQDSSLVIKQENLVFEDLSFAELDSAKRYASEAGRPQSQIQNIPLTNSSVQIKTDAGETYYFETPLLMHTDSPIRIGAVNLGFSGDFRLKSSNDRMSVTHLIPLEEYISGVIPNEIGSNAPLEALKAQAVAARTHAISLLLSNRHKNDGYDLCNSTHCQVYKGKYLLNDSITQAVSETASELLLYAYRIAESTYHSACGGKTDSSANIWKGSPLPYLEGVTCCAEADSFELSNEAQVRKWIEIPLNTDGMSSWEKAAASWQTSISKQKLAKNLGLSYLNRITINKRGCSGRIIDMSFYGSSTVHLTSEYKIRQAFGNASSSLFYIRGHFSEAASGEVSIIPAATLLLKGRGSGHGVGMCQVGALRLARKGESYRQILEHYYPGTTISKNWMQDE